MLVKNFKSQHFDGNQSFYIIIYNRKDKSLENSLQRYFDIVC